ncbi:MAG TPA: GNAT family N-acetyltransferase [Chitinophagaceae bacterium]
MTGVNIRKAAPGDVEQLLAFEQEIIHTERPFDPTVKPDPINYYDLKAMLVARNVEVLVAEIGNRIIASGYARIEKSQPFLKHTHHAYLGFMYVAREYRGQGINKEIIGTLAKWALSQNIHELRLEVYYDNVPAIKAYEKFGFKKHMIEMRFNLDDQGNK